MTRDRWIVTIHVTGRPREVEVLLYDRVRDLRAAATRHDRAIHEPSDIDFSSTLAVVHSFRRVRFREDGTEEEHPLAAIIRFARGALTPLIVAHEVMHVTAALYGFDMVSDTDLVADLMHSGNEDIAELHGELFGAIWSLVAPAVTEAR